MMITEIIMIGVIMKSPALLMKKMGSLWYSLINNKWLIAVVCALNDLDSAAVS